MNPLNAILDIEKDIAERLTAERAKAAQWLQQSKLDIEQSAQSENARLQVSTAQAEASARDVAAKHSAEIVQRARTSSSQLELFDPDRLKQLVWKHIAAIVPGRRHDR